jgi:hypothetical protein
MRIAGATEYWVGGRAGERGASESQRTPSRLGLDKLFMTLSALKECVQHTLRYPLARRERGAILYRAGPLEYILYLGGEIFSGR